MLKIEIYTKNICIFCDRAKDLCQSKKLEYTEYNIETNPTHLPIMLKRSKGFKTMPQIFINNDFVGGFEEFKNYFNINLKNKEKI